MRYLSILAAICIVAPHPASVAFAAGGKTQAGETSIADDPPPLGIDNPSSAAKGGLGDLVVRVAPSGGAGPGDAPAGRSCDADRASGFLSLPCLNARLRDEVNRQRPRTLDLPPLDARSPDIKVGVVNVPAVQQQYGRNFGVSAYPYRPVPPVFNSGLSPR